MRRTDLASEARELYRERQPGGEPDGVVTEQRERDGFKIERVNIINEQGAALLGKPEGAYITVTLEGLINRDEDSFQRAATAIAEEIKPLIGDKPGLALVVGLGNRGITPDALGPIAAENSIVTRHLVERMPEYFGDFRPVSVIAPGVMGTTGIATAEYVRAVAARLKPALIIAVDALASRRMSRLCRTVQISDSGISPGSGTGGDSPELSRKTLDAPVIAVGVPTIVESSTLIIDSLADAGIRVDESRIKGGGMVTPKEIDEQVKRLGKLIGYALNLALHSSLDFSDIETFLA